MSFEAKVPKSSTGEPMQCSPYATYYLGLSETNGEAEDHDDHYEKSRIATMAASI